jgi:hypothetical protein
MWYIIESDTPMYTNRFFEEIRPSSENSARVIVPILMDYFQPRSVIDLGCGDGTWLKVFLEHGVEKILGIDGYAQSEILQIPSENFLSHNLCEFLKVDETFDMALSLEVAEHLPQKCLDTYISSLIRLAPIVIFSAAIPHQGGVGHVSEYWQGWWADQFRKRGFVVLDCIRPRIWDHPKVSWWYAQNMLVFIHSNYALQHTETMCVLKSSETPILSVVHPRMLLQVLERMVSSTETPFCRNPSSNLRPRNRLRKTLAVIRRLIFGKGAQ